MSYVQCIRNYVAKENIVDAPDEALFKTKM